MSPDFAALAEVFGVGGMSVAERGGVVPAIRQARERSGPVLIDFQGGAGGLGLPDCSGRRALEADDSAADPVEVTTDFHRAIAVA